MKKFIRCMGVGLLAMMLVVGCGSKAKGVSDDDLVSKDSFKGEYLITAKEAKKLMGDDNVIFLDCRGEKYSNKETIKGAAATSWQALGTCEDKYGKQGDENWGKVPQPAELSKKLSNLGLDPNKEIVLLGETLGGWGEDARVLWELRVAGYTNLKMVDGGYEALVNAGAETQKGPSKLDKVDVKIDKLDMTHDMETEELQKNYKDYKIVDVRTKVYGVNKKPANQLALIKYIACNIVYYLTLGQIIFTFISVRRFTVKHSVSHFSCEGRYLRLHLVPSE